MYPKTLFFLWDLSLNIHLSPQTIFSDSAHLLVSLLLLESLWGLVLKSRPASPVSWAFGAAPHCVRVWPRRLWLVAGRSLIPQHLDPYLGLPRAPSIAAFVLMAISLSSRTFSDTEQVAGISVGDWTSKEPAGAFRGLE